MTNKQILLLLILFLSACKAGREVSGIYSSSKSGHVLHLYADGRYSYSYKRAFFYHYSSGTYSQRNKQVILKSFYPDKTLSQQVQVPAPQHSATQTAIQVTTTPLPTDSKYYYWLVTINNSVYRLPVDSACFSLPSNSLPKAFVSMQMVTAVNIPGRFFDTLYTRPYQLPAAVGDSVHIQVAYNDSLFNYQVFRQEAFTVKKKRIYFQDQWLHKKAIPALLP